jgi:hypothetical protein
MTSTTKRLALGLAAAALLAPAPAGAHTGGVEDARAQSVTALDGTLVWVSGSFGRQRLVQRTAAGFAYVKGAPTVAAYRSIDLGRDRRGDLVLTYLRCGTPSRCTPFRDDLEGHRASYRRLALRRCGVTTAPAVWRTRAVYGLECRKGARTFDAKRSGLYVKTGSGTPRRLRLPRDAIRFGANSITAVDIRGTVVAAVAADIYSYAFTQTVGGRQLRSFFAAASEGEGDARVSGLSLAPGGVLWALVTSSHTGDPNEALVYRFARGCLALERLPNASAEQEGYRAVDIAADGSSLFLVEPGHGLVPHEFMPAHPPSC